MSLNAAYDDANIFAKILAGDMPCHRVHEDALSLSFMDVFPQSRGHVLVLPKARARTLFDLDATMACALMGRVKMIAHAVRDALAPDGVVVTQFNGAPAGQTVFHLHVHVIPRYEGRALAGHASGARADDPELAQLAAQIAAELPAYAA